MGNTFGHIFRVTTWGESHGGGVGVVVDGCPPLVEIDPAEIQADLDRRRPGASALATQRKETDEVRVLSGLFEGKTLGTPILLMVENKDARSKDYEKLENLYRPSHADFTYDAKYGIRNWLGGGRASARETVGRVAAGAIARKILRRRAGVEIVGYVESIHDLVAAVDPATVSAADVERSAVRCPDEGMSDRMAERIREVRKAGDSVGGIIGCVARHVPAGLGAPVFDKLEAELARAMLSIPASKGFEIGSGFAGTAMRGSEHNDPYIVRRDGTIGTESNRSGGIQGASPTARIYSSASRSSRPRPSRRSRRRSPATASRRRSRRAAGTIRACCLGRFPSSRRWLRWFWSITC